MFLVGRTGIIVADLGALVKLANRLLPGAGGEEGNESQAGSQLGRLTPERLTKLADRATEEKQQSQQQAALGVALIAAAVSIGSWTAAPATAGRRRVERLLATFRSWTFAF